MTTWDSDIFAREANVDFLDELSVLDGADLVEAVRDAVILASNRGAATEDEVANGQAAATIAAIWSGAPFTAGEVVEAYPFIRPSALGGVELDEALVDAAVEVLESVDVRDDQDVDPFLEALA